MTQASPPRRAWRMLLGCEPALPEAPPALHHRLVRRVLARLLGVQLAVPVTTEPLPGPMAPARRLPTTNALNRGEAPGAGGLRSGGVYTFLVCNIAGFSSSSRDDPVRLRERRLMYEGLERSLRAGAGLELDDCYHEDRGDGVMVIVPPEVRTERLLADVVDRLRAEVRRYNQVASESAQMRLRVAVTVGEVEADAHGVVGRELTHAFRLLDAEPLKQASAAAEPGIAVIVSRHVYEDVERDGRGLVDPGDYHRVEVRVKDTESEAWIRVPGRRPALAAAASLPAEVPVPVLFQMVDVLLDIPQLRNERGRERLMRALTPDIAGAIPRSLEARTQLFAILQTCLDYPGGLQQFLQAVREVVGESVAVRRLEQTTAQLLQPGD